MSAGEEDELLFQDLVLAAGRLEAQALRELRAIRARLDELERRPEVMTVSEFATACGCHADTVRTAIAAGQLRFLQIGQRTTLIPVSELEGRFANDQEDRRG